MGDHDRVKVWLCIHRDDGDAWLVSRDGVGAGTYLPKSQVDVADGASVGFRVREEFEMPNWLAMDRGFVAKADEGQGSLL